MYIIHNTECQELIAQLWTHIYSLSLSYVLYLTPGITFPLAGNLKMTYHLQTSNIRKPYNIIFFILMHIPTDESHLHCKYLPQTCCSFNVT